MNAVDNDFFNFDSDIVNDLVNQGFEGQSLILEFKKMKANMPISMDKIIEQAEKENVGSMSKKRFGAIISL